MGRPATGSSFNQFRMTLQQVQDERIDGQPADGEKAPVTLIPNRFCASKGEPIPPEPDAFSPPPGGKKANPKPGPAR